MSVFFTTDAYVPPITKSDTSKFIKNAQLSGDMVLSVKADDKQSSVQMKRLLEAQTILTDENSD